MALPSFWYSLSSKELKDTSGHWQIRRVSPARVSHSPCPYKNTEFKTASQEREKNILGEYKNDPGKQCTKQNTSCKKYHLRYSRFTNKLTF